MALSKNTKTIIQFVVLLALGVLLVWLVSRQVADKKQDIFDAFKNANYFWVVISGIIAFFSHLLRAYRWNSLLNPIGYHAKWYNAFGAVFIGYFANYGIPRSGELSRCTIVAKYDNIPFEKGLGTVVTERIIDFFILLLVFVLTMLFQFKELTGLSDEYIFSPLKRKLHFFYDKPILAITIGVFGLTCLIALFLLRKKIKSKFTGKFGNIIKGFGGGLTSVKEVKNKPLFVLNSIGIWALYLLSQFACFFAFEETSKLGLSECLVLLLFGTFGVMFTPGGLGAYHAIITAVLVYYSINDVTAFAYPWILWTTQLLVIAFFGTMSLIALPILNKNNNVA
jgi:uncharacterized protein (TIRG00374 family)